MLAHLRLLMVLTVLLPAVGLLQAADDTIDLSPVWKKGQISRYRIDQTELTTLEVPESEGRQTLTEFTAEATWEVLKANESGGGTARFTLEKIHMNLTGPDGQRASASASAADERLQSVQQWIRALEGAPIEVEITADADVGRARGFQAVQGRAGDLGESLDENYFREIAMELAVLIGGPAKARAGQNWNYRYQGERRSAPPGQMEYDCRFELKGVEKLADISIATVQRDVKMRYTPTPPEIPADVPLQVNIALADQSSQTQLLFDASRREIVGGHYDQNLVFRMTRSLNGQSATISITERLVTQLLRISEE